MLEYVVGIIFLFIIYFVYRNLIKDTEEYLLSPKTPSIPNKQTKKTENITSKGFIGSRLFRDKKASNKILETSYGLSPQLSLAAGSIVDLVIRDFIMTWYKSPDKEFIEDVRCILCDFIGGFLLRTSILNLPLFLIKDVAPILRRHVRKSHYYRRSLLEKKRNENDVIEEKDLIDSGFTLHPGVNDEGNHAREIVIRMLRELLSTSDSNCYALIHLSREIIVNSIFLPILDGVLHPYLLNKLIVSKGEGDQSTTSHVNTPSIDESLQQEEEEEEVVETASAILNNNNISILDDHFHVIREYEEIEINNIHVTKPELELDNDYPFVSYTIEIRASINHGIKPIQWIVKKRYSQFEQLDIILKKKFQKEEYSSELPPKRGVSRLLYGNSEFDVDFINNRSKALDEYMQSITANPRILNCKQVHHFLSVSKLRITQQLQHDEGTNSSTSSPSEVNNNNFPFLQNIEKDDELSTKAIYDLVDELLLLKQGNFSFLRKNLVSLVRIVVQGAFKGSLFKQVHSWSEQKNDSLTNLINSIRDAVWPNGKLASPVSLPDDKEQEEMARKSLEKLKIGLPKQVVTLIGIEHANLVAVRSHDLIQYHTLNKSLVYQIADAFIDRVFPEHEHVQ